MRTRKQKSRSEKAMPDLTPMIDVTFQLLIFFILCTRFMSPEEFHRADLPDKEGMDSHPYPPKEQITIYCVWDPATRANSYVLGLDARGRVPVEGSMATLSDVVIYPSDSVSAVARKKAHHQAVFDKLVDAIESYLKRMEGRIEKLEISFAHDATVGAASGTAPWMFVSMALDACVKVNLNREKVKEPKLPVNFKFADALEIYR
jgi:biopolymer transport protein ExbD